jgi:glycosyltransferase involved in cell wall biosynthesis
MSPAQKPIAICVCGQTPPPVHGQAVMIQSLVQGSYSRIRIHAVRMAFSSRIDQVGKPSWPKLLHLFKVAAGLAGARFRHGATVLYYPPAGPDRVPMWRDMALLLLARRLFRKTVYHYHIAGLADLYASLSRFQRFIFRLAYGRPALAIYLSAHSPDDAAPLNPQTVRIIPNGIAEAPWPHPVDRSRREPSRPPIILFVGALTPEKGVDTLLETWSLLRQRGTPFQGVLAGDWRSPQFGQETLRKIAALGLSASIRLAGPLEGEAKWRAFAEADVFCFPSHVDNFPLVEIEAMMMGLPIVASDWGGMKDLVVEGETGFRAPRGDAAAFADKLDRLLNDPALRIRMGEAGRARYLQEYTLDRWRNRMEQALAECAGPT